MASIEVKRNRKKKFGIRRAIESIQHSLEGLVAAIKNEQSFLIIVIFMIIVVILGIVLKMTQSQWIFALFFFGLLITVELLNTSIEAVVDMTMPDIHPLAKIAKDTASAAEFVISLVGIIIMFIIFVPKIVALF